MSMKDQQAASLDAALDAAIPEVENTAPAVETPTVEEQPLPEYEPPAYWKPETKEAWKALHGYKEGRPHLDHLHKQWGETTRYLTKIEQERAELKKRFEPLNEYLTPYIGEWARQGLDPVGGLRTVLSWRDALQSDPQGTLLALAQEFGVNLADAVGEAPYVDPVVQQLQQQLTESQRQMAEFRQQYQQKEQQAQQAQFLQAVNAFENETDADGKLKHPFFRDVVNDMVFLYQSQRAQDPESAYKLAVQLNPDIQAKLAENARLDALNKAKQQTNRAEAAVAKSGVAKASPSRGGEPAVMSLDDALTAAGL